MGHTDTVAADKGIAVFAASGADLAVTAVPSALVTVEKRVTYPCGTAMQNEQRLLACFQCELPIGLTIAEASLPWVLGPSRTGVWNFEAASNTLSRRCIVGAARARAGGDPAVIRTWVIRPSEAVATIYRT